jgi:hypothetical protein
MALASEPLARGKHPAIDGGDDALGQMVDLDA